MAITHVGTNGSSGTSLSSTNVIAIPSGTQAGDVVIIGVTTWSYTSGTFTITGGSGSFTQYANQVLSSDRLTMFWKRLTAAEAAGNYTITKTSSQWGHARVSVYRGVVDTGNPYNDFDFGTSSTATRPTVTTAPTVANSLLDWEQLTSSEGSAKTPPTSPAAFTEIFENNCGNAAYLIRSATGSVAVSGSSDSLGATNRIACVTALTPAATGTAATATGALSLSGTASLVTSASGVLSLSGTAGVQASAAATGTLSLAGQYQPAHPWIRAAAAGGRYFVDQYGDPIMLKGDTIWTFVVYSGGWGRTYQTEMTHYANTRAAQGFNAIHTGCLSEGTYGPGGTDDYFTWDGVSPWASGVEGNLNETYWVKMDYLIDECARVGITVFLNMMYQDDAGGDGALGAATNTECLNYGFNVATRYLNRPNVAYAIGGDWFGDHDTKATNVFNGIRNAGETRLFFVQNYPESTSRTDGKSASTNPLGVTWSQMNYVYTYDATYNIIEKAYTESTIPTLWGDGTYDGGAANRKVMRDQFGWAFTSGGLGGHMLGTEACWQWLSGAYASLTTANGNGQDLPMMRSIFEGLAGWHLLVPDHSSTWITAGRGTKTTYTTSTGGSGGEYTPGDTQGTYVTGAKTPDGSLAVLWFPVGTSTVTINTAVLPSAYTARWIDPVNGASTTVATGSTYSKSGNNAGGGSDWILVLEEAEAASATADGVLTLSATAGAAARAVASGVLSLSADAAARGTALASGVLSLAATAGARAVATATGVLSVAGAAGLQARASAAGDLTLAGVASGGATAAASGSLTLSGDASTGTYAVTAAGSVTLSGTATVVGTEATAGSGVLSLSGTATVRAPLTASGSLSLSGTAVAEEFTYTAEAAGVLTLSATATVSVIITANGSLSLSAMMMTSGPPPVLSNPRARLRRNRLRATIR